jgi:DDE superfamily endonuclease
MKGKYDPISSEDSSSDNENIEVLPIKVNWKKKKTFTKIRSNYKNYNESDISWCEIFEEADNIRNDESKFLMKLAKKYNCNYKTLKNKYSNWRKNDYVEQNENEHRGNKTKFNSEEEKDLFEYIKSVYIETNLFFDDECLSIVAKRKWDLLYPELKDDFTASRNWVYYFKKRWNLSSYKGRNSKKANTIDITDTNLFIHRCKKFLSNNPPEFLFNLDETFWRLLNGNLDVIGITGSENRKVITNLTGKEGFTATFLITANGDFHKPTLIFKGKTDKCLNKFSLLNNKLESVILKYNVSGWNDSQVLISILEQINKLTNENGSVLILDQHRSHTGELIENKAKELNIQLIYVPVGQTANLQPLDIKVNGALKSIGHRFMKNKYVNDPYYTPILVDAVESLIYSVNKIDNTTIKNSFNIFVN